MTGRNERGRFVAGNTIAQQGWCGLVAKRFDGDVTAARAWLAQLGRWSYAQQALAGTCLAHKLALWPHPGRPEQFAAAWRERLNFSLSDVEELGFGLTSEL